MIFDRVGVAERAIGGGAVAVEGGAEMDNGRAVTVEGDAEVVVGWLC